MCNQNDHVQNVLLMGKHGVLLVTVLLAFLVIIPLSQEDQLVNYDVCAVSGISISLVIAPEQV